MKKQLSHHTVQIYVWLTFKKLKLFLAAQLFETQMFVYVNVALNNARNFYVPLKNKQKLFASSNAIFPKNVKF